MSIDSNIIGSFHVDCGKVRVSDPCYACAYDKGCTVVEKALDGEYVAFAEYYNDPSWGVRVSSLSVVHYDYLEKTDELEFLEMFELGVDSGQMSVFDDEFYRMKNGGEFGDLKTFYGVICNMTLSEDYAGIYEDKGVACSTGYGDGTYVLKVGRNKEKEAVAFYIEFIRT